MDWGRNKPGEGVMNFIFGGFMIVIDVTGLLVVLGLSSEIMLIDWKRNHKVRRILLKTKQV